MAGSTYRERREARAEKLREWSDKRAAKAAADYDRAHQMAEAIPFGQPIITGRGSRTTADINYRERIHDTYGRAFANMDKAAEMAGRAAEIEYQADRAIYDDDPDAIERLREKLANLEAERGRITAFNAAVRKAKAVTADALAILSEEQRDRLAVTARVASYHLGAYGSFPAYALSNLSGNIKRTRDRIASLERRQAPDYQERPRYLYSVKYASKCRECGAALERGTPALYYKSTSELACVECPKAAE